jgi:hypothetical protein
MNRAGFSGGSNFQVDTVLGGKWFLRPFVTNDCTSLGMLKAAARRSAVAFGQP